MIDKLIIFVVLSLFINTFVPLESSMPEYIAKPDAEQTSTIPRHDLSKPSDTEDKTLDNQEIPSNIPKYIYESNNVYAIDKELSSSSSIPIYKISKKMDWDLNIGASLDADNNLILTKEKQDQAKWNAILKLVNPKNISEFFDKTIYFFTETSGDSTIRLAPNFLVNKNNKTYEIFWTAKNIKGPKREFFSFVPDETGLILGNIYLPKVNDAYNFYAQETGAKPFLITDKSAVNLNDLKQRLSFDWQHDIPGAYQISETEKFPGAFGNVKLKRFYMGDKKPQELIQLAQADWLKNLAKDEIEILTKEFAIQFKSVSDNYLLENEYLISEARLASIKNFYERNKAIFKTDPYFTVSNNYFNWDNIANNFSIINKDPETVISIKDQAIQIFNKNNTDTWTIVKLGEITSQNIIKQMQGVNRLRGFFAIEDLVRGHFSWQTVILDLVQYDEKNQEITSLRDDIQIPLLNENIRNYYGSFSNEFIISSKTKRIELLLKIAGSPDHQKDKKGIKLKNLKLDKIVLSKKDAQFNNQDFLASIPKKPYARQRINNKDFLVFQDSDIAIIAGNRTYQIDKNNAIELNMPDSQTYTGIYTNIFDVSKTEEIELTADIYGKLRSHGIPQNWAVNTIDIEYYNKDGEVVYPADHGEERYPSIKQDPNKDKQTLKKFFNVPFARGAKYAQVKIHFVKSFDLEQNIYDPNNYYTGNSIISNIIIRPALNLSVVSNFAPENGSFYKHNNGRSLTWSMDDTYIIEDIKQARRVLVFENKDKDWSAIKTELIVPENADILKGVLNPKVEEIRNALAQWQGFGLFLEADVADNQGNVFHYSGIPVFKKENGKLVKFDRIASTYDGGKIEYFVPLVYENLRVQKIYWQIALAGRGKATLNPITEGANASLLEIRFLKGAELANIPAFWSQYALASVQEKEFKFEKHYQTIRDNDYQSYESLNNLNERLNNYLGRKIDLKNEIGNLEIGQEKEVQGFKIKAMPSYARVNNDYKLDKKYNFAYLSFDIKSHDKTAKFNFKPSLLDKRENLLSIPFLMMPPDKEAFQKVDFGNDVFDLKNGRWQFIVPLNKKDFASDKIRFTFGSNQGEISFSNLEISFGNDKSNLSADNLSEKMTINKNNIQNIFQQANINNVKTIELKNERQGMLDNREMYSLKNNTPFVSPIKISLDPKIKNFDHKIRENIKKDTLKPKYGSWHLSDGSKFMPLGFTIVGETFNKWYDLRRLEFKQKTKPYWYANLSSKDKLIEPKTENEFIKLFMRAQANIWQEMGVNTIRTHQFFANWAGLNYQEIELSIQILKMLQEEYGFLIIFDLLPNPDFTNDFYTPVFGNKEYARAFSNNIYLFKANLLLPEIRQDYIKPAIHHIFNVFKKYNFKPNSLSYANETGFIRGFWTLDKNNSNAHPYFSRVHHYYYQEYLEMIAKEPKLEKFIQDTQKTLDLHIEATNLQEMLKEIIAVVNIMQEKSRIKDNASFLFHNLLWDGHLANYPNFGKDILELKELINPIVNRPADLAFYQFVPTQLKKIEKHINDLSKKAVELEIKNAKAMQAILSKSENKQLISDFNKRLFSKKMPNSYQIPQAVSFEYIDTFNRINEKQARQAFFTSFLFPVSFAEEINQYIYDNIDSQRIMIGLNNDFAKDIYALLANAYLFVNDSQTEIRFNKYTHHPVGGHSMLLNPGNGNVFDLDSKIAFNLDLFTPPTKMGFQASLSETNYTFTGDDASGEGTWTINDYLKIIGNHKNILGFHFGPNNLDKPIIDDYFNMANFPSKTSMFGLLGVSALAQSLDKNFIGLENFYYNKFKQTISFDSNNLNSLSGFFEVNKELKSNNGNLAFKYNGKRNSVAMTISSIKLGNNLVVSFYTIERNTNQKNRQENTKIVQSFGVPPVQYLAPMGILKIKLNSAPKNIYGINPAGRETLLPKEAYKWTNKELILDTSLKQNGFTSYRIAL